jgi:hypothetical protein
MRAWEASTARSTTPAAVQERNRRTRHSTTCGARRPRKATPLPCKGAPLRQCDRVSLLVNLPGDEMPLLIELVVHLSVN